VSDEKSDEDAYAKGWTDSTTVSSDALPGILKVVREAERHKIVGELADAHLDAAADLVDPNVES
jgi:hypothetical protein